MANLNAMVNAAELTIYSLVVTIGTAVVNKGKGVLSGADESRCFPVTSVSVSAALGDSSGGGSFCNCTVIPSSINKAKDINDMSATDDGEKFLSIAKPGSRASVAMSYSEDGGKTVEVDVLYVGMIGGVSVTEGGAVGAYMLSYSLEIVHPAVFIASKFITNPHRFGVWQGNALTAIHPAAKSKALAGTRLSNIKGSENGVDVCKLALAGLDAAAPLNRNTNKLNDITVSDIVDVSGRPILAINGLSKVFDNPKGGTPISNHIITSAYDGTMSRSPWSVFSDIINGFGLSTAPVLFFDLKDTDPLNKNTKFSVVGLYMPFISFKATPDPVELGLDQIISYTLRPPHTDDNDSAAIAVNYTSKTTTNTSKRNSGSLFVIINAGHTPAGKPFYICGTIDENSKKSSKTNPAFIDVKLTKITARGAYSLSLDKVVQLVELPRWCKHPSIFKQKPGEYLKVKKAFAEFWGNVAYASKCNSFGSMSINIPLYEALQLRGDIGRITKVTLSSSTILVGGIHSLSFSIEASGNGFKTSGKVDLAAIRSEEDDEVLGLPLSTVSAMYRTTK